MGPVFRCFGDDVLIYKPSKLKNERLLDCLRDITRQPLNVPSHDDSKTEVVVFGHTGRQEADTGIRWAEFGEDCLFTTFLGRFLPRSGLYTHFSPLLSLKHQVMIWSHLFFFFGYNAMSVSGLAL